MTHPMTFAEDYLDFDPEEAEAEYQSALPPVETLEEEPEVSLAVLLRLDAEWKRVDLKLKAAALADELEVIAGRLDKADYQKRDQERQAAANAAKQALEEQARQVLAGMNKEQLDELVQRGQK